MPTFDSALEAGFSSGNFDISTNARGEDSREGMDAQGLMEVRRLMECVSLFPSLRELCS